MPPIDPRVSVVLPVHNAAAYLVEAVESIRCQSLTEWEMHVIDDGSSDDSAAILERFAAADPRILFTSRPNRGLAATLNEGIDRARCDLVALMNADDVSHPGRLEAQLRFLTTHPRVAVLGTQTRLLIDGHPSTVTSRLPLSPHETRAFLATASPLAHPSVMLRRGAVIEAGGYRPHLVPAEDYDLWTRVAERHDLANLPQILLDYRIHAGQASAQQIQSVAIATLLVRAGQKRKRASGIDMLVNPVPPDRAAAAAMGIGDGVIASEIRQTVLGRAESVLAATGSGARARSVLEAIDDSPTSQADPMRWQATHDWLDGRVAWGEGRRLAALRLLVTAALHDASLARRLVAAGIRRARPGRISEHPPLPETTGATPDADQPV